MSDPGETSLFTIESDNVQKRPTEPKKRGRPPNTQKTAEQKEKEKKDKLLEERYRIFLDEYIEFCNVHPDYGQGKPRINNEMDLTQWEAILEGMKKKKVLDEAIEGLPDNFVFFRDAVQNFGTYVVLGVMHNVELHKRIDIFSRRLTKNYKVLEPLLIELLVKHDWLRFPKAPVELRLLSAIMTCWGDNEQFDKDASDLPEEYDGF